MKVIIREGTIEEAVIVSRLLPEFHEPHGIEEYYKRLSNIPHLILVALADNKPAGFKVGYERNGGFYSWMGGVVPAWRRQGIAKKLAVKQEEWARIRGYDSITFKTRNQHKNMLIFALKNGFDIIDFKEKKSITTNRILLKKIL